MVDPVTYWLCDTCAGCTVLDHAPGAGETVQCDDCRRQARGPEAARLAKIEQATQARKDWAVERMEGATKPPPRPLPKPSEVLRSHTLPTGQD